MTVTADEINYLVRRHLQEMGYVHTAYVFSNEALVDRAKLNVADLPPQALVTILKKGMLYMQMEKGINEKAKTDSSPENIVLSLIDAVRKEEPIVPSRPPPRSYVPPPPPVVQVTRPVAQPHIYEPMPIPKSSVLILKGHFTDVYCGAWTKDGKYLATGSGDATAIIWEIQDHHKYVQHYILDHATQQERAGKDIATLAWNPSGTILATGCYDGTARLWTNRGELKFVLSYHDQPVFTVQFSPDGTMLLTGSADYKIVVWNVATGDVRQVFQVHRSRALDVDWLDNKTFASCSGDAKIAICTIGQNQPKFFLEGHTGEVNKIEWDPSGKILASCSDDKTVRIWRPFERCSCHVLTGHTHHVYTIKWAPNDSKILASGAFDFTVRLWDVSNNSCISVLSKHSQPIYTICFSPKGKFFVSGGIDDVMNLWSTSDSSLVASYQANSGIFEAQWDSSGQNIALCLADATVAVISTQDILLYQE
ncbi:transducin [Tritrichomonas foetus]|uniref:Transducin n=1 Tax=Tritrichomonas foetus TaxID=1144522 RepID=A0A1J4J6H7_9EUKA|nr:transducin [Tritrichomonas foetus]|eukprot:OHS94834.1 transducin [Tritrichomonas foetus]